MKTCLWRKVAGVKISRRVLAGMGKEFTTKFYAKASGSPAKLSRAYFNGCSGGGRMGVAAAENHPEDYDGYLIGAPSTPAGGPPYQIHDLVAALQRIIGDPAGARQMGSNAQEFVKGQYDWQSIARRLSACLSQ